MFMYAPLVCLFVHSVSNERRVCTQWRRCMFRELFELCCECFGCCCVLYVVTKRLLFIAFKSRVLVQLVADLANGHADFVDGLDYRGWRHPSTHARSACGIVRTMFGFALIVSVLLAVECHEACPNTDPFPIRVLCAWVLTCPFELHNGYTCFEYVSGTGDLVRNMFSSNGKASLQLARKSERCRNSDVPRMCPMQMKNECRDACSVRLLPEHKRWLASRPKICFSTAREDGGMLQHVDMKENLLQGCQNFGRANTLSDFPKAPKVPKQFERGKKKATFCLS